MLKLVQKQSNSAAVPLYSRRTAPAHLLTEIVMLMSLHAFFSSVLKVLKTRPVKSILIVCFSGLAKYQVRKWH